MKNNPTTLRPAIRFLDKGGSALLAAILLFLLPVAGFAQDTASAIRGKIYDSDGNTVSGVTVVIEDARTGVRRDYTSNAAGTFFAANLPVGGPYIVTVSGAESITISSIALGDVYNLRLSMLEVVEEIVTIGTATTMMDVATGPSASFSNFNLETAVAFNRDIKEVYALDPRLNLGVDGSQVYCGGQHPRFNSVTLDGVSQNDRFGLNTNGYSTATGMPFPFAAIEQVSVELAPFDVTYSGFSACNINAVSKSGSNDWEFGIFYEFTSENMIGEDLGRDGRITSLPFDDTKKGFSVGGPILRDRLFFFAAYEESESPRFLAHGYDGSGNGVERPWLSQTDYERIVDIANIVYDYDTGGLPQDGSQTNEKYMLRLDWNITDRHNAAMIYTYFDGPQHRSSDSDPDEFEFANHFYVKGAEDETVTLKLYSQWTDAFSTELYYNNHEMIDSQVTVGPKDFPDMQISINGRDGVVYLGADDSRQANALNWTSDYFKMTGQYLFGDHVITAGYEREKLQVFNQFVQHARGGEYDFFDDSVGNDPACAALSAQGRLDDVLGLGCQPSGIDRFELGRPSRIYYGSGGGTNDPADAAAQFGNTLHSFYIQDEILFDDKDLSVVFGLRYETFESSDRPNFNQTFTDANGGLRNDANIDGLDILLPRLGFTWGARDDVSVRGGVGLYTGGNPNVWLSNAWSNDGLTNVQLQNNYFDSATVLPGFADSLPLVGSGRPGYDIPQELFDEVAATTAANASDSRLVLIDPNYKQPAQWKYALGATWDMPWWEITADLDVLHTEAIDSVLYVDLSQAVVGTTITGQPIYDYVNGEQNYMLTNSSDNGSSTLISAIFRKDFDSGLDVMLGYAFTEAEDVSPMTSFVAGSNFDNLSLLDINNPSAGNSNYVVPHRFTLRVSHGTEFFGDYTTRFTLYGFIQEGRPQSYVMSSGDLEGGGRFGRHLLYVPSGPTDPNVIFDSGFDQDAFFRFIASEGLKTGFQGRNAQHADWSNRFDIAITQEIPIYGDLRGQAFFKVYNVGNMLDPDWGKQTQAQFFSVQVVESSIDPVTGQYIFEDFFDRDINNLLETRSLWQARIGININFN